SLSVVLLSYVSKLLLVYNKFFIYIFLFMLRQTPTFTLFPYTTLFRSPHDDPGASEPGCRVTADRRRPSEAQVAQPPATVILSLQDRKSTRLNSSHVKISYAVFCLKKKTT